MEFWNMDRNTNTKSGELVAGMELVVIPSQIRMLA